MELKNCGQLKRFLSVFRDGMRGGLPEGTSKRPIQGDKEKNLRPRLKRVHFWGRRTEETHANSGKGRGKEGKIKQSLKTHLQLRKIVPWKKESVTDEKPKKKREREAKKGRNGD